MFRWNSTAKNNTYVKMLLGFGGGVLLCTTFMHLLPEVSETIESLNFTPDLEIPYAELLMCIGFFTIFLVEECVHLYLHYAEKDGQNKVLMRTSLSLKHDEQEIHDLRHTLDANLHMHNHAESGHSHMQIKGSGNSATTTIRGLLIVMALSVHELFEGLAVGLENTPAKVWYLFGAVSAHKFVIAFCIGIELVTSDLKLFLIVIYIFTFAVVSPIGIGIGILVSNTDQTSMDSVSVALQGLATGTLLYVVFFEILQAEKKSGLKQFAAIFLGFVVMLTITLVS